MPDASAAGRALVGAVTVRTLPVVLFFARHPDEELLSTDCALKLQIGADRVHRILAIAVQRGILTREGGRPGGPQHTYRAGPVLLAIIQQSGGAPAIRATPQPEPDRDPFRRRTVPAAGAPLPSLSGSSVFRAAACMPTSS